MTLLLIALSALIVWGLWTLLRRHRDDGEAPDPDSSLPFSPGTTSSSSTAGGGAATAFTVMGADDASASPADECRSDDAGSDSGASCDSSSDSSSSSGD